MCEILSVENWIMITGILVIVGGWVITKNQIRYQSLHSKRSEVIAKLFSKLATTDHNLRKIDAIHYSEIPLKDKINTAKESLSLLSDYYIVHRIYFKEKMCISICAFIDGAYEFLSMDLLEGKTIEEIRELHKVLNEKVITVTNDIEIEFRAFLNIK